MSERWPAPTDPIAFESLCADLWGSIWGHAAQKNGRNGQPQAGVDVYGKHGNEWIGIQCKQKDELLRSKLTPKELAEEVEAARRFAPPLRRFIVATTGPADATIQEAARRLTEELPDKGCSKLRLSWSEIWLNSAADPPYFRSLVRYIGLGSSLLQLSKGVRIRQRGFCRRFNTLCFRADSSSHSSLRQLTKTSSGSMGIKLDFVGCLRRQHRWMAVISCGGVMLTCKMASWMQPVSSNLSIRDTTFSIAMFSTRYLGLIRENVKDRFQKTNRCSSHLV